MVPGDTVLECRGVRAVHADVELLAWGGGARGAHGDQAWSGKAAWSPHIEQHEEEEEEEQLQAREETGKEAGPCHGRRGMPDGREPVATPNAAQGLGETPPPRW